MARPDLRFGTFLAPSLQPTYRFVAEEVGRRLNLSTELVVGRSKEELVEGDLDVSFACSPCYVEYAEALEVLAAPVLTGERFGGRAVSYSDIIVGPDSDAKAFSDLRDLSFAFNGEDSFSGYWAVLNRLAEMGEKSTFFTRWHRSGWHQVSIELVADSAVDAAAVDAQVLALEWRSRPELAQRVRVIESIGPYPIQPVVASRSLPEQLRERIRQTLVVMAGDSVVQKLLCRGFIDHFLAVDDSHYDGIREMLKGARPALAALSA